MNFLSVLRYAALGLCLCVSTLALSDSLQLKDGRLIQGKYLGGTSAEINFLVGGEVQRYPISSVLLLNFSTPASAAATNSPAPSTPTSTARSMSSQPQSWGTSAPSLQQRKPANNEATVAANSITVPAGQRLVVRMIDGVDSARNQAGDRFQASLEEPLTVDGELVAPKGTEVSGRLSEANEGGRVAGRSELRLELISMRLNGQDYALSTGEYEVSGKSRGASTAKKVGGGAALGAIIGAVAGGGKGAAIGAGVGAGAGTAVSVMTRGEQVHVPSETVLEFTLRQATTLPISAAAAR